MSHTSHVQRPRDNARIERLSSLDAVFLAVENGDNPMNIGSLGIFNGPVPPINDIFDFVDNRIAQVRRCRQRVRMPRGLLGRPLWIDDAHFDIRRHVHAFALSDREELTLEEFVTEVMVTRFDRHHPLWEVWVVDGLPDDQWAVVSKVHHCMVDGIAGNDLLVAILTNEPTSAPSRVGHQPRPPEPTAREIFAFSARTNLHALVTRINGAMSVVVHPIRTLTRIRMVVRAAKRLWYRQQRVSTSLVGPIGDQRSWTRTAVPLTPLETLSTDFGCTVNDIVLAAVSRGFRDLLIDRGELVDDRILTAMVPVSIRPASERGETGNRVANVHACLPIGTGDLSTALTSLHRHLDELKTSHEVDATGLLMRVGDYVPRFAADRIARAVFHRQRNVETVITNVPGPSEPLHLGSYRMVEGYPIAPIGGLVRVTVAVWSYCNTMYLGVTGDRDSNPDLHRLTQQISLAFEQLSALGRQR